jgi:sulfate/thiosulfate-binding protein
MRRISLALLAAAALLAGGTASAGHRDVRLSLVAYSTPKEAYTKIISAFQKTPQGQGISFDTSYGASGEQSRAVAQGLPADVVAFSLEPDVNDLVRAGIVATDWKKGTYHGTVSDSVVVFVLRDGNPKHIKTWNGLVKSGVEVLTPNPFTSGGARWNVMAAYGAQRKQGKKDKDAIAYLYRLFQHVTVQDKSARDALQTFLAGKGDALLTYENEAILARQKGQPVQYVIPRSTILIENPVAVTKTSKNPAAARAFVRFLYSPAAQRIFAQNGYRPVVKSVAKEFHFPARPGLFTIDQLGLGGWDRVQKRFFDSRSGVMADIERKVGGGTGG